MCARTFRLLNKLRHRTGLKLRTVIPQSIRGRVTFHHGLAYLKFLGYLGIYPSSRYIEYCWILKNLPQGGRVLDVGCTGSYLHCEMIGRGFEVYGIDISDFPRKDPSLIFIKGDIMSLPFRSNFFDIIVAVSTIEHIGLGAYGNPMENEGDMVAMKEIVRVAKPSSLILITVPYAKVYYIDWQRHYDGARLQALTDGLNLKSKDYFAYLGKGRCAKVPPHRVGKAFVCMALTVGKDPV